ncbi:hypothetical protein [Streptosporangium sp. NPDC050280]|uniref:hypothetical protein n=1 Tax=unclassified Streptosporangium TaxID=2632669 RepID=UPI0034316A78
MTCKRGRRPRAGRLPPVCQENQCPPNTGQDNLLAAIDSLTTSRTLLAASCSNPGNRGSKSVSEADRERDAALIQALLGVGHALVANTLAVALGTASGLGRRDPVEHRAWLATVGRLRGQETAPRDL